MSYENLKKELITIVQEHYQGGTPINDIRAAIHVAYLLAEQFSVFEVMEIAKSMPNKPEAEVKREP